MNEGETREDLLKEKLDLVDNIWNDLKKVSEHDPKFFEPATECLTLGQIKRYVYNELDIEEKERLEKHVSNCNLCLFHSLAIKRCILRAELELEPSVFYNSLKSLDDANR